MKKIAKQKVKFKIEFYFVTHIQMKPPNVTNMILPGRPIYPLSVAIKITTIDAFTCEILQLVYKHDIFGWQHVQIWIVQNVPKTVKKMHSSKCFFMQI